MSTEENKALARKLFELLNRHELDRMGEVLAADYVHHDPQLPLPGPGLEPYQQACAGYFTAFPDAHMPADALHAEGDRVAVRWTFAGTHTGPLGEMPATGRSVRFSAIQICRVAKGRIAEGWVNFDTLGMLQQLGAIPPAA